MTKAVLFLLWVLLAFPLGIFIGTFIRKADR